MQLVLNVYESPEDGEAAAPRPYPKQFVVDHVRGAVTWAEWAYSSPRS